MLGAIGRALIMSFAMTWEIFALILAIRPVSFPSAKKMVFEQVDPAGKCVYAQITCVRTW
jgi:hypothetical protein